MQTGTSALPPLVLASRSPRRAELLASLGLPFTVQSADVDETPLDKEPPLKYVQRIALLKARTVAAQNQGCVVLAADTPVIVGNQILQNPATATEAQMMLRKQSNRRVQVPTAVVVIDAAGKERSLLVPSWWKLKPLSELEIESYLESNQWCGVSGAIKSDICSVWFTKFFGSPSGATGLPLYETAKLLRAAGLVPSPFKAG